MQVTTLRPGLLVSLKSTITGNVSYKTRDIVQDHIEATGERIAAWETERTVALPDEHERAVKVRSKARGLITAICAPSTFGLLCPESRQDELEAAIREARDLAEAFNSSAAITRVSVFAIPGRIAADDIEAVRAINSEVRDLLAAMDTGIARLDVKAVRDAADRARALGQMLSPEAEKRISQTIETVRAAARKIVKAGEVSAREIEDVKRSIAQSRTVFLDLDEEREVDAPSFTGRAIDLMPAAEIQADAMPAIRQFDLI